MRTRITLAAVVGLLAMQGCAIALGKQPSAPAIAPSPDVGQPVVLDRTVRGWEASAWLSKGSLCVRAARTGEHQAGKANEFVFCDPAPSALDTAGPPLLPAKPQPFVEPAYPQSKKTILIGTVRGAITTVSVTMFGETATANVHPLPATGGRRVGAYAVWLPSSGSDRDGMELSDIAAVVGRDATGEVVAQLS